MRRPALSRIRAPSMRQWGGPRMGGGNLASIVGALLSGSFLPFVARFLWRRLRRDPVTQAEARKLNAEAERIEWQTLRDEIERLTATVKAQGKRIAELEQRDGQRDEREGELERENKSLRAQVSSLRKRVAQLEEIITTKTTPEDMRAQLAEIDRKTAERESGK
jgi:chromosome segregation ATPase